MGVAGSRLRMAKVSRAASSFKFYYDVVCPFAYMASTVVEGMAKRCGARVDWTPVLLGRYIDWVAVETG